MRVGAFGRLGARCACGPSAVWGKSRCRVKGLRSTGDIGAGGADGRLGAARLWGADTKITQATPSRLRTEIIIKEVLTFEQPLSIKVQIRNHIMCQYTLLTKIKVFDEYRSTKIHLNIFFHINSQYSRFLWNRQEAFPCKDSKIIKKSHCAVSAD